MNPKHWRTFRYMRSRDELVAAARMVGLRRPDEIDGFVSTAQRELAALERGVCPECERELAQPKPMRAGRLFFEFTCACGFEIGIAPREASS